MTMELLLDVLTAACILGSLVFFLAGTVGLLRFPDVYNRLHAVTKADNLGLGLVVLGLCLQTDSLLRIVELVGIWLLVLLGGATSAHLISHTSLRDGLVPWERP